MPRSWSAPAHARAQSHDDDQIEPFLSDAQIRNVTSPFLTGPIGYEITIEYVVVPRTSCGKTASGFYTFCPSSL